MSLASRRRTAQNDTGQTAIAGAAASTFAGATQDMSLVQPGTLMARCVATIATGSLTLTPSWQVSDDASTWENVKPMNNAANVAITATSTLHLEGPSCLSGKKYARAVFLSAGATATTGDFKRFSYSFCLPEYS
jgi:hypothetical protein